MFLNCIHNPFFHQVVYVLLFYSQIGASHTNEPIIVEEINIQDLTHILKNDLFLQKKKKKDNKTISHPTFRFILF
jgi:hypothetical protein